MKTWIAVLVLAIAAAPARADELEDAYKSLKAAESAKDPDGVLKWSATASALARKIASAPKPDLKDVDDAEEVLKGWQARVDYANQVDTYTEYALYAMAAQPIDPAKTIALFEELEKRNEKSPYVAKALPSYMVALSRSGNTAKLLEIGEKAVARDPANEDALLVLADGYLGAKQSDKALGHALKLVEVMESKPKPEGLDDASWEKKKGAALGRGYWIAGVIQADKKLLTEANKNLRAALPHIQGQASMLGPALFYLGVVNYQLAKTGKTPNKAALQDAAKFSEQSAAIPGPYQQSAVKNHNSIRAELSGQPVRKKE